MDNNYLVYFKDIWGHTYKTPVQPPTPAHAKISQEVYNNKHSKYYYPPFKAKKITSMKTITVKLPPPSIRYEALYYLTCGHDLKAQVHFDVPRKSAFEKINTKSNTVVFTEDEFNRYIVFVGDAVDIKADHIDSGPEARWTQRHMNRLVKYYSYLKKLK